MKKRIRRGRPTSYAFANDRHQRPTGTLLFPSNTARKSNAVMIPFIKPKRIRVDLYFK